MSLDSVLFRKYCDVFARFLENPENQKQKNQSGLITQHKKDHQSVLKPQNRRRVKEVRSGPIDQGREFFACNQKFVSVSSEPLRCHVGLYVGAKRQDPLCHPVGQKGEGTRGKVRQRGMNQD